MICKPCQSNAHHFCPKGTWCDCQHRGSPIYGTDASFRHADAHIPVDTSKWANAQFIAGSREAAIYLGQPTWTDSAGRTYHLVCTCGSGEPLGPNHRDLCDRYRPADEDTLRKQQAFRTAADEYRYKDYPYG